MDKTNEQKILQLTNELKYRQIKLMYIQYELDSRNAIQIYEYWDIRRWYFLGIYWF